MTTVVEQTRAGTSVTPLPPELEQSLKSARFCLMPEALRRYIRRAGLSSTATLLCQDLIHIAVVTRYRDGLALRWSRERLAEYSGITSATLSRAFQQIENAGLIRRIKTRHPQNPYRQGFTIIEIRLGPQIRQDIEADQYERSSAKTSAAGATNYQERSSDHRKDVSGNGVARAQQSDRPISRRGAIADRCMSESAGQLRHASLADGVAHAQQIGAPNSRGSTTSHRSKSESIGCGPDGSRATGAAPKRAQLGGESRAALASYRLRDKQPYDKVSEPVLLENRTDNSGPTPSSSSKPVAHAQQTSHLRLGEASEVCKLWARSKDAATCKSTRRETVRTICAALAHQSPMRSESAMSYVHRLRNIAAKSLGEDPGFDIDVTIKAILNRSKELGEAATRKEEQESETRQKMELITYRLARQSNLSASDLRRLSSQILFALTRGVFKARETDFGINICLRLIREGRWTEPRGWSHS